MEDWYNLSVEKTFQKAETSQYGLTEAEAQRRIERNGENKLPEENKKSILALFLEQFKDLMTLLLIGAAAVSGAVAAITRDGSDLVDTFIIVFIIFLNAILGFVQQYRADKAIEKLKKMALSHANVYRDGKIVSVSSLKLAVGDVIALKSGDVIPADCRIISCHNFACDESSLTGESTASEKTQAVLTGKKQLGDRHNMAYSATFAVSGRALAVVVAVGAGTEIGKIAGSLEGKAPKAPLQKSLDILGKVISVSVIVVAVIVFITAMFFREHTLLNSFMSAIAIAVAAIPEGMPAVVTIIMAMGVQKMSRAKVVVRRLHAVETLGSCTCICSDKTGTLTQNKMTVERVVFASGESRSTADGETFHRCAASCHSVTGTYPDIIGDGTEKAIVSYLAERKMTWKIPVHSEIPFDSERKMMSVSVGRTAYHKGGFDIIISKCDRYLQNGKEFPMTEEKRRQLLNIAYDMAQDALRVIAFAYNSCDGKISQKGLVFIAFAGMFDAPKSGTKEAIEECSAAGIKTFMITGDHAVTAGAIAVRLGISGGVTTGAELDCLAGAEKKKKIMNSRVFARVTPAHKREIVEVLQGEGEVVAMTGDGINDAPGLKKADIGVAMGISGTDVTKNAADMVIADDNFSTIVGAVREGRRIFDNIRKTICFFLATNAAEVLSVLIATLVFFKYEFLRPTQLLWINLITDSFPVLALGVEKADDNIMLCPPKSAVKSLWNRRTVTEIILFGLLQTALTLSAYVIGLYRGGEGTAITMAFLTLSFLELLHAVNVRSNKPVILVGFKGNIVLLLTVAIGIVLSVSLCYIPFIASAFGLVALEAAEWGMVAALSLAILPLGDIYKLVCGFKKPKRFAPGKVAA